MQRRIKELAEKSKRHSDKALQSFAEANELYDAIKNLPRSKERDDALIQVLEKDSEAIAEVREAIKTNEDYLATIISFSA